MKTWESECASRWGCRTLNHSHPRLHLLASAECMMSPMYCEHLTASPVTSVSHNLLMLLQTARRGRPGGREPVCSAALHRCFEWLTHRFWGGKKTKKNSSESMLLSSFLSELDCTVRTGCHQWKWSSVSDSNRTVIWLWSARAHTHTHTLRYTNLHTTIHMYTDIVFESRSISLCKYKCITFQILQHKCW